MPLSNLNREQLKSATAPFGHNLIIASAGTGKTSTIVGRIAHLLKDKKTTPEKILLLTFTNKASKEMIARLTKYFPKEVVSKIEAGTFHSVSYKWLREINPRLTLKQPSELKTFFKSIYEKRNFNRLGYGENEHFQSSYLYELFNLYQNTCFCSFDEWLKINKYEEREPLIDIYLDIVMEYESLKKEYGFLSFNDLLLKMREYLSNNKIVFDEVLVDEYQDTNTLQGALIDDLKPKSLFCVGDYDQSIYAFNGANIKNISTFKERYKKARVFNLSINYRSVAPILELADEVIKINPRIYPKKLKVGRKESKYFIKKPKLLKYETLFKQYRKISEMILNSDSRYKDIAILFRNNSSADGIETSLKKMGIPYKRKGGVSFFETKEIKFLLDFLSLVVNPKDMMAFIHIFENAKGVGASKAKDIFISLQHFGDGNLIEGILKPKITTLPKLNPNKNIQLGLFDNDLEIGAVSRFSHMKLTEEIKAHPILKYPKLTVDGLNFFIKFHKLFKSIHRSNKNPFRTLKRIKESNLYQGFVESLARDRAKLISGEIDKEREKRKLDEIYDKSEVLLNISKSYKKMSNFINAMVLGSSEMEKGSGVNLLTIHASKGLEFEEVYIIDLMEGRFPNRKLIKKMRDLGSIEEERRLFYVAVTRAKDKLYLSYAKEDIKRDKEFEPSIFLKEGASKIDKMD